MSDDHAPEIPADSQAAEPTQVLPAVDVPAAAAPFDPASADELAEVPEPPAEPARPVALTVPAGSRVIAIVSRGPSPARPAIPVAMPDVLGEAQGDALIKLQDVGLSVQVLADHSDQLPGGYIMGQYPLPGVSVQPGTDAVLLASRGKSELPSQPVVLPKLAGMSQAMAVDVLQATSLVPRIHYDYDPVAAPGIVLAQLPSEEARAEKIVRKLSSKLWLIAVAVLMLIAMAAAGVWFFNRPMTIPNLIGMSQGEAEKTLQNAGFKAGAVGMSQTVSAAEIGNVIAQAPDPGGTAAHGSTIDLVVSGGQVLIQVPNVTGKVRTTAEGDLAVSKLLVTSSQAYSASVASGTVIAQAPAAGQRVPSGTTVGLTVSMGPHQIVMQSVTGQSQGNAETSLRLSGLGVRIASNYDTTTPVGNVIGQLPTVSTAVQPGKTVGLTVSRGPAGVGSSVATVPVLAGKTVAAATKRLAKSGLRTIVVTWSGTGQKKGRVVAQLPDVNVMLTKKSRVIIFVSSGN
jgi:beta-lactam-binding protein with PASTA domain